MSEYVPQTFNFSIRQRLIKTVSELRAGMTHWSEIQCRKYVIVKKQSTKYSFYSSFLNEVGKLMLSLPPLLISLLRARMLIIIRMEIARNHQDRKRA